MLGILILVSYAPQTLCSAVQIAFLIATLDTQQLEVTTNAFSARVLAKRARILLQLVLRAILQARG